MPIIVKDYTWTQTLKMLHIRIVINPGFKEKVDIFTADSYVKAHFSPFIFEAFLLYDIDSEKSKAIIKEDLIVLDLVKREEIEWECLEKDLTKAEKMKLKQEILDKCREEASQKAEDKRIKKTQLERFTVQKAMEIDTKLHNLMDSRRDSERDKAMTALEEWRVGTIRADNTKSEMTITELSSEDELDQIEGIDQTKSEVNGEVNDDDEKKSSEDELDQIEDIDQTKSEVNGEIKGDKERKEKDADATQKDTNTTEPDKGEDKEKSKNKGIVLKYVPPKRTGRSPERQPSIPIRSDYVEKKKKEAAKRVLPRLRERGDLEIKHTPRTFPTPSRESSHEEEQAWLKNMTLARRATGFVSEDLRPEEQDPQWCKEKGDEFFRNGNFLGAVSAYSHGITLSDKLPSLYSNRAAVHFALGNFNKCVNDCSSALDLLKPACESNRKSRAKCIARRAAAMARMGYLHKAIEEMKAASKLLPEDETLKKDIYDMERAWEQNPDDF